MRLNRFLAAAGFGSRRACEELIASGVVAINGHYVEKLATQVSEGDEVRVSGRLAKVALPIYLLINKPRGFVVTRADELGRKTVFDLLPPQYSTLFHVGRLDKESEGLLLLTNDGELTQRLTHPTHEVEKEYEVTLDKAYNPEHTAKLQRGIFIEGGRGKFEKVRILAPTKLRVVLRQGIKRQIRLMFYDLGYEVERLVRIRIGSVRDPDIKPGTFRFLRPEEVSSLRGAAKPAAKKPARPKPAARKRVFGLSPKKA